MGFGYRSSLSRNLFVQRGMLLLIAVLCLRATAGWSADRPAIAKWEIGDWWVIETMSFETTYANVQLTRSLRYSRRAGYLHYPGSPEDFISSHYMQMFFQVTKFTKEDGEYCAVIQVAPYRDEPHWRNTYSEIKYTLYVSLSDLFVKRVDWNVLYAEGKAPEMQQDGYSGSLSREARIPFLSEVEAPLFVPLDIPLFTKPIGDYYPVERIFAKDYGRMPKHNTTPLSQVLHSFDFLSGQELKRAAIAEIRTENWLIEQIWVEDVPWWIEWRKICAKPNVNLLPTTFRARMVKYGSKGDSVGKIVPPVMGKPQEVMKPVQSKSKCERGGLFGLPVWIYESVCLLLFCVVIFPRVRGFVQNISG